MLGAASKARLRPLWPASQHAGGFLWRLAGRAGLTALVPRLDVRVRGKVELGPPAAPDANNTAHVQVADGEPVCDVWQKHTGVNFITAEMLANSNR